MPRIFDNIDLELKKVLREGLSTFTCADMCVGYFNLRGWGQIYDVIDSWPDHTDNQCRLLIGMHATPQDELKRLYSLTPESSFVDQSTASKLKAAAIADLKKQLTLGFPTNTDETTLQALKRQIENKRVKVKLFLKHPLHAKLYLLHRQDPQNPRMAIIGSSNLTLAGLKGNGELNVDVLDHDATEKLHNWFNDRWNDRLCIDISDQLIEILAESWARDTPIPPYYIYLKIAYHLSIEAQAGLAEFKIPKELKDKLFDFQSEAVRIAANLIHRRGGCLIADVVGIGKTRIASAAARILQDDLHYETLIICPVNLVPMWKDYVANYRLVADVMPITEVQQKLQHMRRFRLVVIDESHNLRNPQSKRYRAIQEYILSNESKVILLSATPYNKTYLDLSTQLKLFLNPEQDLGIRPESYIRLLGGETEFRAEHPNTAPRSINAFEFSNYADDWRELMRLFMIRRTRSFIESNYAKFDDKEGLHYLPISMDKRMYFPKRTPKTVTFTLNDSDPNDQYASLFSSPVVDIINNLKLPRYGLGRYINQQVKTSSQEDTQIQNLSRAGKRLIGFCRTNLFKRLESSGYSFLCSIERHILRNLVFIHALETSSDLPIGTQDVGILDTRLNDTDPDGIVGNLFEEEIDSEDTASLENFSNIENKLKEAAETIYTTYRKKYQRRFKWLRATLFNEKLKEDLLADAKALLRLLKDVGKWQSTNDSKLEELIKLVSKLHNNEKVLIFSQFADTVDYLERQLSTALKCNIEGITGQSSNPAEAAWRFSPVSNEKKSYINKETRILIATDVLSEGQNLQDSHIIVNYDLPWAIIRLIQRAGRVDRIGQKNKEILAYTFMPAEGVERIINLRSRLKQRLKENEEVVGTDEQFFEDDSSQIVLKNLFTEKSGILNDEVDGDVDLGSFALQIWKNATAHKKQLAQTIENLPDVVYSAMKPNSPSSPEGVIVYTKTAEDNDVLSLIGKDGIPITESQFEILRIAECAPNTPATQKLTNHHHLVSEGLKIAAKTDTQKGGQLGSSGKPRAKIYDILTKFIHDNKDSFFVTEDLKQAVQQIYLHPLTANALDTIARQLKIAIEPHKLAELVQLLYTEDRLCQTITETYTREPRIICSLGLTNGEHS